MSSPLNDLAAAIEHKNEATIKRNLQAIISQGPIIELQTTLPIEPLFQQANAEILRLTAEAIAETAKSEHNRKILTTKQVTGFLLGLFPHEDNSLTTQACRGLGNVCFENESARELVGRDGLKTLLSVIRGNTTSKDVKLQTVAWGFMLNLVISNDELQKAALELSILKLIEDVLKEQLQRFEAYEDCCTHVLSTLNMLTDHLVDAWLTEGLCSVLVDVLKVSSNPEISVLCLEVLHGQSENSDLKMLLAKKGICQLVYELVEKYKDRVDDEESRGLLKMACDIIVLILMGDEPMDLLYNDGNGVVYKNMLLWLNSDDFDLLSTGILAIGNFARNDAHCIQMVQNGIAKKLLDLLSKHNTVEKDVKVQHAILGALRNLVILPQNKAQILREGLVTILYPMLNVEYSHVTFKLLGTLRIVIDGQEKAALDLVMRKELLEKLVDWCFNSDHLGVRGEASRLLAWLVKHCHSAKPYPSILRVKNCVKCLVDMISSNHAVMQNEAFFALTLLCTDCLCNKTNEINTKEVNNLENGSLDRPSECPQLDKTLIEADIGRNLNFLVNKYKDKLDYETVVNLLTLLELLVRSQLLAGHLKSSEVGPALLKLADYNNVVALQDRVKQLSNTIDGGSALSLLSSILACMRFLQDHIIEMDNSIDLLTDATITTISPKMDIRGFSEKLVKYFLST